MTRLTTFLSILALSMTPLYADNFGANDKVLYFTSNVLIDVITKTFPQELQLDVAKKYIDIMDKNGNVSIADLVTLCSVGGLDNTKCRTFIGDLINATGDNTLKPFYWADYVGKGTVTLGIFNSADGYFNDHKSINAGDWGLKFSWMKEAPFLKAYPDSNAIIGTSACTSDDGIIYTADNQKQYANGATGGENCWCKMTGPEETPWVYLRNTQDGGGCPRSCAVGCLNALYGDYTTEMQKTMFTGVKLNKSIAHLGEENIIQQDLIETFKPCEFDWAAVANDKTYADYDRNGLKTRKNKPLSDDDEPNLDYEQWFASGFQWINNANFQCKYQGVTKLKGVATCNNQKGVIGRTTDKSFKENQNIGPHCWCKIIYPEQSKWLYVHDFYSKSTIEIPVHHKKTERSSGKIIEKHDSTEKITTATNFCNRDCLGICAERFYSPIQPIRLMIESIAKK